jgi:hypothetical protein
LPADAQAAHEDAAIILGRAHSAQGGRLRVRAQRAARGKQQKQQLPSPVRSAPWRLSTCIGGSTKKPALRTAHLERHCCGGGAAR